jgi:hypothetical protein
MVSSVGPKGLVVVFSCELDLCRGDSGDAGCAFCDAARPQQEAIIDAPLSLTGKVSERSLMRIGDRRAFGTGGY